MSIWYCKIGTLHDINLPDGADWPMRNAIRQAFADLTGQDDEFCFSGWSAELTEGELAVVQNREPVHELVANESPEMLRAALAAERERADRADDLRQIVGGQREDLRVLYEKAEAERDELRDQVARLVGAIHFAPHAETCTARYTDIVGGMKVIGDFSPVRSVERPCNCWKRTALEGK